MTHRFLNFADTFRLPSFAQYLIDELFMDGGGLARRICRHRLLRSWPSLSALATRSRGSAISA